MCVCGGGVHAQSRTRCVHLYLHEEIEIGREGVKMGERKKKPAFPSMQLV